MGGSSARFRAGRVITSAAARGLLVLTCISALGVSSAAAGPAQFGEKGSGAGQIGSASGVAIEQESSDVYVADSENNRIEKFGPEGEFLLAWGWGVADGVTEALQTCTITCFAGIQGAGAGQFGRAEGLAVDNDPLSASHGDVYVIDSINHRIEKFDSEGKFILAFGSEGKGPGQFERVGGRAIAVDAAGNVHVGDDERVQQFSPGGVVEGQFAVTGSILLEGVAVDSANDVYVEAAIGLSGVHKYEADGKEVGVRDETGQPSAIALGPSDELFIVDGEGAGHHIFEYNAAGTQLASFDSGNEGGTRGIAYGEAQKALYLSNGGSIRILSTPPPGPLLLPESESASKVQPATVTLCATINSEGETTEYHFEYGTTTAYGNSSTSEELKGGAFEDQPACAAITGLAPSTTYHYRVVASNAGGTVEGSDQSFTTLPPVSIDSTSVSAVNDESARLETELNPHGVLTEYHFEYDTTSYAEGQSAHGTKIPIPDASAGSGTTDVTRTALIQHLAPATTYHYRVIAHNALGTEEGPDRSFTTQPPTALVLPDGRAWEQVSPSNKHGSPIEPITVEGGVIQAAASGGAMTYVTLGPLGDEAKGVRSPEDDQWLSRRGASGWTTQDITTPREELSKFEAGNVSEYKLFSDDLSAGIVEPKGATPLSPQTTERTPYRRETSGEFVPLVTAANVPAGVKFGGGGVEFETATPGGDHALLSSSQLLAPGFKAGFKANEALNLYELSGTSLQLISVLPSGEAAAEAGLGAGAAGNMRGAISSDGGRVVFVTGGGEPHLYMRDVHLAKTLQVDEPQQGALGGVGQAVFQAASADGDRVFFTDEARLTIDATAKPNAPDLYMCEVKDSPGQLSCALRDLTVDQNPGEAADVQGKVAAIDATGNHVYFAANGVLTSTSNEGGEHAVPGICNSEGDSTCNLYEYDTIRNQRSLVAVLSSHDDPDWAGRTNLHVLGNLTARSSPNGRYFTFMSERSLTGYDNHDQRSGQHDEEVFLFDSTTGALRCASCNPTGARPLGVVGINHVPGRLLVDYPVTWGGLTESESQWLAASIPGWTLNALSTALYQSRYLSNSGRLFFNASDALVPQDTNGVEDVYQYEPPAVGNCSQSSTSFGKASGGCVNLISSGSSKEESAFLDASETGDEAFFLTASRLALSDVDGAFDVYDAHACSSSSPCPPPPPPPPPACEGDSCQSQGVAPSDATPGSLTYHGPGNASPTSSPPKPKPKALTRAQLLKRALAACKKKKSKKQRTACQRQAHKRYGAKTAKAKKKANARKSSQARKGRGRG